MNLFDSTRKIQNIYNEVVYAVELGESLKTDHFAKVLELRSAIEDFEVSEQTENLLLHQKAKNVCETLHIKQKIRRKYHELAYYDAVIELLGELGIHLNLPDYPYDEICYAPMFSEFSGIETLNIIVEIQKLEFIKEESCFTKHYINFKEFCKKEHAITKISDRLRAFQKCLEQNGIREYFILLEQNGKEEYLEKLIPYFGQDSSFSSYMCSSEKSSTYIDRLFTFIFEDDYLSDGIPMQLKSAVVKWVFEGVQCIQALQDALTSYLDHYLQIEKKWIAVSKEECMYHMKSEFFSCCYLTEEYGQEIEAEFVDFLSSECNTIQQSEQVTFSKVLQKFKKTVLENQRFFIKSLIQRLQIAYEIAVISLEDLLNEEQTLLARRERLDHFCAEDILGSPMAYPYHIKNGLKEKCTNLLNVLLQTSMLQIDTYCIVEDTEKEEIS